MPWEKPFSLSVKQLVAPIKEETFAFAFCNFESALFAIELIDFAASLSSFKVGSISFCTLVAIEFALFERLVKLIINLTTKTVKTTRHTTVVIIKIEKLTLALNIFAYISSTLVSLFFAFANWRAFR